MLLFPIVMQVSTSYFAVTLQFLAYSEERMSLLDTINIQGIRSIGIGEENAHVIEFLNPLTIICGPNGSGKTTIIEALKFVTTGELPKGKLPAFIHDVKLTDRSRVDACVKLKFRDIRGRDCVITRRLVSRIDCGKTTCRSEECTIALQKDPGGPMKSLSSKVIDCKKEILNLLGVPAAILEYVVFCHQEECTWPLDEPKKLKERFDEIFQVTGYVKAIDLLKKEVKENTSQLKVLRGRLPLLIRQQEHKVKLHDEYIMLKNMFEKYSEVVGENSKRSEELEKELKELECELNQARKAEYACEKFAIKREMLSKQLEDIDVPDYNGTIAQLHQDIALIASSAEFLDAERDRESLEKSLQGLAAEEQDINEKKEKAEAEIARMTAVDMMREKLLTERTELAKKISTKYSFDESRDLYQQLDNLAEQCENDLEQWKVLFSEKLRKCQDEYDTASHEMAEAKGGIAVKNEECERIKTRMRNMKKELTDLKNSGESLEPLKVAVGELERKITEINSEIEVAGSYDDIKREKENCDEEIIKLKTECERAEGVEIKRNELTLKEESVKKLKGEHRKITGKHKQALSEIFDGKALEYPISGALLKRSEDAADLVRTAEQNYRQHELEMSRIEQSIAQANNEILQNSSKLSEYERRIQTVVPSLDELPSRLANVEKALTKARTDLGLMDGCRYLFEKWSTAASESRCCPLCERSCRTQNDVKSLMEKITQKKQNLPAEIKRLEKIIQENEDLLKKFTEITPYVPIIKELEEEVRKLEQKKMILEKEWEESEKKLSKAKSEKMVRMSQMEMIQRVQVDGSLIDNIWQSLSECECAARNLAAELKQCGNDSRSVNIVRADLRNCEESSQKYNTKLEHIQALRTMKNQAMEELEACRERREKIAKLDGLKRTLSDDEETLRIHENAIMKLETKLKRSHILQKEKAEEREKISRSGQQQKDSLNESKREVESARDRLKSLEEKIGRASMEASLLEEHRSELHRYNLKLRELQERSRIIKEKAEGVSAKQEEKRRLDAQLNRINLNDEINRISSELEKTKWKGKDIDRLCDEEATIQRQKKEADQIVARSKGEMNQIERRITEMKEKLDSKEILNAEDEYKRDVIEKCVTEKVNEDLNLYIRIVDESIVKFHTEKMEQINEVLATLWDKVYKGNDIETIQIKSESVDESEKKKSYNYRVVMTVDGTEMDMPGRCSAGQKMLASILIRVALSDVFCDRCSVIALDEPTTNLDVHKIENLGETLAQLIEARKGMSGKNFQLIVITHDNIFVEHLRLLCRPEWVYALSKDSTGLSRVKRHKTVQEAMLRTE